jgi:3-oxoacyl-[acyl-carrier protein] reductase
MLGGKAMERAKRLQGKGAVVTGGSRGIGRAVAERLAADGAAVAISYVTNRVSADETVAAIAKDGGRAVAVQADIASIGDVRRLFEEAQTALGDLDIVVANAGTAVFRPHVEVTPEEFDRIFGLNARGTFFVLQEAARRVRDGGRIVNISSGGTAMASPGAGLYLGSKAATELFVAALAKELGPRKVTVNSVSPGVTRTEGLVLPEQRLAQIVAMTPLGRLGEPADIADAIAFLASDDARWVTAQNLRVAGG